MQNTILDTEVTTIDGEVTSLQPYSGNVLLIVNVASKCGLTPQYEQLEKLQKARTNRASAFLVSLAISFWAGSRAAKRK